MDENRLLKIWQMLEENGISPEEGLDYLWQFDPETAHDTSISAERSTEIGAILDKLGITHAELDKWLAEPEVDSYLMYGGSENESYR